MLVLQARGRRVVAAMLLLVGMGLSSPERSVAAKRRCRTQPGT